MRGSCSCHRVKRVGGEKPTRGKTRKWIRRRKERGYFTNIIQELIVEDRHGFREMFRMDVGDFEFILIISYIVKGCCKAIVESLTPDFIKVPATKAEWLNVSKRFEDRWNYPHALGAIDGKHVRIQKPKNGGSFYYNYKHTHSIILMAIASQTTNVCTLMLVRAEESMIEAFGTNALCFRES